MSRSARRRDRSRASLRRWLASALLVQVAAACFVVATADGDGSDRAPALLAAPSDFGVAAGPTTVRSPATRPAAMPDGTVPAPAAEPVPSTPVPSTPQPPGPTAVRPEPAAGSAPTGLRIPAIGVSTVLGPLGLNSDRTVEVPTDFATAGWFAPGPSPGQVGSAVILGHVDSRRGPAVFYRLSSLQAGDRIEVSRADGSVAHFAVTAVSTYLKSEFPARQVYGSRGVPALQLVTCGGEFDPDRRSYLSNVVAYTAFVGTTPPV